PLLQKISPQHLFQLFGSSPLPRLGIVRFDQPAQLPPRHHLLHLFQKHRPSRLLRVPLESRHHRQRPLPPESVHAGMTLSILAVEREYSIRVSLWDLNAGLGSASKMGDQQRRVEVLSGWSPEPGARRLDSRKEGCCDEARTRMHRRVGPRPRVAANERVRKN